jgi:predicted transcriptional regulator
MTDSNIPAVVSQAPAATTWIANQTDPIVQGLCQQFKTLYRKERKTLSAFGKVLKELRDNPNLKTVDASGKAVEPTTNMTAAERTFSSICEELGVPVRTAYHYIATYIATTKYSQEIQDAAVEAGLNLALDHVQAKYDEMKAGLPAKPTPYELKGIIAELETATPPKKTPTSKLKGVARFQELLKEAFSYAEDEELPLADVQPLLEAAIAVAFGMPGARVTREKAPIYTSEIPADVLAKEAGA